jgi:hypothetical protein
MQCHISVGTSSTRKQELWDYIDPFESLGMKLTSRAKFGTETPILPLFYWWPPSWIFCSLFLFFSLDKLIFLFEHKYALFIILSFFDKDRVLVFFFPLTLLLIDVEFSTRFFREHFFCHHKS